MIIQWGTQKATEYQKSTISFNNILKGYDYNFNIRIIFEDGSETTINKELEDYLFSDFNKEEKEQFDYLLDKVYKKAVDYARKDWKKK